MYKYVSNDGLTKHRVHLFKSATGSVVSYTVKERGQLKQVVFKHAFLESQAIKTYKTIVNNIKKGK